MKIASRSLPFAAAVLLLGCIVGGCSDYGEKLEFNKGELYYGEGVTEAEATKLGEYLVKEGYFDGKEKSVQLRKKDDRFIFRAVIQDEYLDDANIASVFEVIGAQMSERVFNNAPVDVHLTDEYLETKKEIPFNAAAGVSESEIHLNDTTGVVEADSTATNP